MLKLANALYGRTNTVSIPSTTKLQSSRFKKKLNFYGSSLNNKAKIDESNVRSLLVDAVTHFVTCDEASDSLSTEDSAAPQNARLAVLRSVLPLSKELVSNAPKFQSVDAAALSITLRDSLLRRLLDKEPKGNDDAARPRDDKANAEMTGMLSTS